MSNDELTGEDGGLAALLHDAATGDRIAAISSSGALQARILADFDTVSAGRARPLAVRIGVFLARVSDAAWPGAPAWKPAAVLGLSLMIGLGVGALLPVYGPADDMSAALDVPQGLDVGGDLR
ncbi:MAG: hypothetical protein ABSC92_10370 [Rhizomicrobium sp.]|jgi:hypothetical protein